MRPRLVPSAYFCLLALTACAGSSTGSIGAILERSGETGSVYVHEAPDGLAAARAGLEPGDEVLMVNGVYVRGLDDEQLRRALRGEVGSEVELTIVRRGEVKRVKLARTALRKP